MTRFLCGLLCVFLFISFHFQAEEPPIFPPPLQKGDTIAVIAPASSPEESRPAVFYAINAIIQKGYRVKVACNLMTRNGYLAGTDYDRAKALMDAWADPDVKAIWCYRGGFGCARILDRLNYQRIRENPKILIGMSDITALHAAINKETGLVTFLGPNVNDVFGIGKKTGALFCETQLWNIIAPETPFRNEGYRFPNPKTFPGKGQVFLTIHPGTGKGRLTGGTLSLVASLIGTPWEIDTTDKILVLEEVDEEPYRIDRMLLQLKQAGLLARPAGVVLCAWKGCGGKKPDRSFSLEQVFQDYFANAQYPVLWGFPSGHAAEQVTLPLNTLAELDATAKTLRLLENPVEVR
ncbi:MAG: LD-carboxypeptidase [Waddliaceae bacterium]